MVKIKKIIILGGGTSGLMAALMLKRQHEHLDIQVIESSAVGTIGVGEGATEHWKYFCETIGVPLEETLVACDATLKTGIKFIDWGVPDYIHATCEPYARPAGDYLAVYAKMIADGLGPMGIVQRKSRDSVVLKSWAELQSPMPCNQFHFNTFSTNDYLHKLCKERGIPTIDDTISDVVLDNNGCVDSLVGTNATYSADFFVDSSGFAKVIMKKLGAKWESYKDNLWVNSAIAFPTEDTDDYPTYTSATAMDYGWMWNTPVRGRWGNGYVFCDKYIDFDQAQSEVEAKLGRKVDIAKRIKFDAGKLDRAWIKNCASIGLASSFVEPLESSAISQSILQTFLLMNLLPSWGNAGEDIAEIYNNRVDTICENILDFIAVHYVVPREDTAFWSDLKLHRNEWIPKSLKTNLDKWANQRLPLILEFDQKYVLFTADNWAVTLHGLGLTNPDRIKIEYDMLSPNIRAQCDTIVKFEKDTEDALEHIPHKEALLQFVENYKRVTAYED
jgi:tryptophan 6-halogenase